MFYKKEKKKTCKNRRRVSVCRRVPAGTPCRGARGGQSCQRTPGSQKPHLPSPRGSGVPCPCGVPGPRGVPVSQQRFSPLAADLQPQEPSEPRLPPLLAFKTLLPHLGEKVPVGAATIKGVIQGSADTHTQLPSNSRQLPDRAQGCRHKSLRRKMTAA